MTDTTAAQALQRQLAAVQAEQLQRGRRQADLVYAMLERAIERTGGTVVAAIPASRRIAGFIRTEGWITGPAWSAFGTRWLVSTWALRNDFTEADVTQALHEVRSAAPQREPVGDQVPQGDTPPEGRNAQPRRRLVERRRGQDQGTALHILVDHLTEANGGGVAAAASAARSAAQFAAVEGWAAGPLWSVAGLQLLLSSWALREAVSYTEMAEHVRQSGVPGDEQGGQ